MNFSVQALDLLVWEAKQSLSSVVPQDYTGGTSVSLSPLLIGSRLQYTSSSAPPLPYFLRWKCIHVSSHRTQPKSNLEWVQSHGVVCPHTTRSDCIEGIHVSKRQSGLMFPLFSWYWSEESRKKRQAFLVAYSHTSLRLTSQEHLAKLMTLS